MAKLIITINPDGTVEKKVEGVSGSSCSLIGQEVIAALGTKVSEERTSEYYATAKSTSKVAQKR